MTTSRAPRPTARAGGDVAAQVLPIRKGYPLLVATLSGRDAETLRTQVGEASRAGADLVEVRLDRLPASEIPRLGRVHEIPITHEWVPAIATLRSRAEGGQGPDDAPARQRVLTQALEAMPFSVIDLELERDLPLMQEIVSAAGRPVATVVSAHLPEDAPTRDVVRCLRSALDRGDVGKVVLPASAERALEELIPEVQRLRGRSFVLHTTGGAGSLLRVLGPRLGMAWVYARLPTGNGDGRRATEVEPSQLPVDQMRRFIDTGPETPWFAVVGHPIGHSLSPEIHDTFLRSTGSEGIYVPLELRSEEEFTKVLPALRTWGLRGANVTRPFKLAAYRLAQRRSDRARESGAVNTLVRIAGTVGGFSGYNTDVEALVRWWKELGEGGTPWDRVLVVGTGGAARAAVLASVLAGAQVRVLGRRPDAVLSLVKEFPPEGVHPADPSALAPFPVVVNATPVGQEDARPPEVPLERALGSGSLLVDLVYRPREPTLRDLAKARGARYVDGMRMLVYQAAESFRLFTGKTVPVPTIDGLLASPARAVAA